jgi:hypothetical protein
LRAMARTRARAKFQNEAPLDDASIEPLSAH